MRAAVKKTLLAWLGSAPHNSHIYYYSDRSEQPSLAEDGTKVKIGH
jgi:hypothetical protein